MHADLSAFWDDLSSSDHSVQIYDTDDLLLDSIEAFVAGGLALGERVVLIATPEHHRQARRRLETRGVNLDQLIGSGRCVVLDARTVLDTFMRGDWPNDDLFERHIGALIDRVAADGRPIRAFGEMVAVLWAGGQVGAALRLEYLWHELCQKRSFTLFCAYPRACFTEDPTYALEEVWATHDRVLCRAH